MTKTTVILTTENQRFWEETLPRGQRGHVLNHLLNKLRLSIESRHTTDTFAEFLTEMTIAREKERKRREAARVSS